MMICFLILFELRLLVLLCHSNAEITASSENLWKNRRLGGLATRQPSIRLLCERKGIYQTRLSAKKTVRMQPRVASPYIGVELCSLFVS